MENDEKMFPEVAQSEACLTEQPTAGGKCAGSNSQEIKESDLRPLTKTLGISNEHLLTLRAEAQRTFGREADAGMSFYKTLGRSILVRIVAWYGGAVNRASGRYAELLSEAAAHHAGFGPEQRQAIEEEVKDFARKKIDQRVARDRLGLLLVNRNEPGFTKIVTTAVTKLADQEPNLISEARANLNRAAAIYAEKPKVKQYSKRRLSHVRSNRENTIREIASLGYKGLRYCREVDSRKISANPQWLNGEGWPGTYEAAYRQDKKWQKRIQQEKWRISSRGKISAGNH
jgi:hypothetical protein